MSESKPPIVGRAIVVGIPILKITVELPIGADVLNGSLQHQDLIEDIQKMLPFWLEAISGAPGESTLKLNFTDGRLIEHAIFKKRRVG